MKSFVALVLLLLAPAIAQAQACFKAPCAVPLRAHVVQPHAVAKVLDPVQHSSVVTTDNSIVVTNTYNFSQPASAQGNTVYGYAQAVQSYGQLDLGALAVHLVRISDQSQKGGLELADKLSGLLSQAQSHQNDVALTQAIGQAAAQIAAAVRPPERATTIAIQDGGKPALTGTLLTRTCGQCHAAPSQDAAALKAWDISTGDRMAAIRAVLDGSMPKGQTLSDETRTGLVRELVK